MSEANENFVPLFAEQAVMYRGISNAYIGNKEESDSGYDPDSNKKGYLYAEYSGSTIDRLGPVTAYAEAVDNGYEGTEQQWIAAVAGAAQNAQDAQTAKSDIQGIQNAINTLVEETITPASTAAVRAAATAAAWASSDTQTEPGAENNAQYWAGQAQSYASDASEDAGAAAQSLADITELEPTIEGYADTAEDAAEDAAEYAQTAEAWAVGHEDVSGSDVNNSKYWAEYSRSYADGKDLNGISIEARIQDNSRYYCTQAILAMRDAHSWATYDASATPSSSINARKYAEDAGSSASSSGAYALDAQAWANGKRGNNDVASTDPAYHNNAAYYVNTLTEMINSPSTLYAVSDSATTAPSDPSAWSDEVPSPSSNKGKYVWCRTTFNWGESDTYSSDLVTYIGQDGGSIDTITNAQIDALFA